MRITLIVLIILIGGSSCNNQLTRDVSSEWTVDSILFLDNYHTGSYYLFTNTLWLYDDNTCLVPVGDTNVSTKYNRNKYKSYCKNAEGRWFVSGNHKYIKVNITDTKTIFNGDYNFLFLDTLEYYKVRGLKKLTACLYNDSLQIYLSTYREIVYR